MPENARSTLSPLSPLKPLSETLLFASNFLRHPNMLGSIIPSSRFLVDQVLEPIEWGHARVIVEYGPGVGTLTGEILRRMRGDAHLVAVAGRANRGRDGLERVTRPGERDGPGLGEAVPGEDGLEGQLAADPADQLDRDVGGTGHGQPQRRQVRPASGRQQ